MTFIWPSMLFSLVLVPTVALLYLWLQRRQSRGFANLGTMGFAGDRAASAPGRRRHVAPSIFILGLALLLLATARPQMVLALPQIEGTVVLAFDVSASMGADDMEPTRLGAAKIAASSFVERQPRNIRIGVVAFSDGGLVVQQPTGDHVEVSAAIDRLVPQTGTSLGDGILAALGAEFSALEPDRIEDAEAGTAPGTPTGAFAPRIIVLLTDGENTTRADPLEAAQIAVEQGVRIYPIGIGSANGTTLEIDGFNVFTRLDENVLKDIARLTEGEYYGAEYTEDLRSVYENLDPQFVVRPVKMEITAVLGGIGMLVLMVAGAISLLWFGRVP